VKEITPETIAAPLARYAHGIEVPAHWRLLRTSGQLALDGAGKVPEGAEAQARLCFENIRAILAEAGMGPGDVAHLTAYVTDRAHMAGYMAARDAFLEGTGRRPASTLLVVAGFTRPEFLVEVEVMAAAP
jgi:enamine deaminase RidA (YjgF/YER057c/UK114 family)